MADLPTFFAAVALGWGMMRIFSSPLRVAIKALVHLQAGFWALRLGMKAGLTQARLKYPQCLARAKREAGE